MLPLLAQQCILMLAVYLLFGCVIVLAREGSSVTLVCPVSKGPKSRGLHPVRSCCLDLPTLRTAAYS